MGSAAVGVAIPKAKVWALEEAQASAVGKQKASPLLNNDSRYRVNMLFSFDGGKIKGKLQYTKFLSSWKREKPSIF